MLQQACFGNMMLSLLYALPFGLDALLKLLVLLDHHADVDGLDSRGRTPLAILASSAAQLEQGSNFCDSRSATSEADAEEKRHRAIEKLLIQAGADQNHSSIAAARRPHQAIRQFNGTIQTSSLLPWTMDCDLAAVLRQPPRHF